MFKIVPFNAELIGGVENIEKSCFSAPWTRCGLESELSNQTARFFVALENGEAIGYIGVHFILDEGYIANLAVLREHRGRGAAAALIGEIIKNAKEEKLAFVSLEVRKSNFAAISLYEKSGFESVGIRKNFYSDPIEDALIMTLKF